MVIANPDHWQEPGKGFKGDKYDKIVEMVGQINTNESDITALESAPPAHKTTHQDGGGDEISVEGLSGDLADAQDPKTHKASHQDGGGDEISVEGLSGDLADAQDPKTHKATHEPGGSDPMAVDAVAATGSLRTLGSGSQQAAAGNHSHTYASKTQTYIVVIGPEHFQEVNANPTGGWDATSKVPVFTPSGYVDVVGSFKLPYYGSGTHQITECDIVLNMRCNGGVEGRFNLSEAGYGMWIVDDNGLFDLANCTASSNNMTPGSAINQYTSDCYPSSGVWYRYNINLITTAANFNVDDILTWRFHCGDVSAGSRFLILGMRLKITVTLD